MDLFNTFSLFVVGFVMRFGLVIALGLAFLIPVLAIVFGARGASKLAPIVLGRRQVQGLLWRARLYYAPGHTWLRRAEEDTLRVGLDDLARRLFGGATLVELPKPGDTVRRGQTAATVHCGTRKAVIVAPCDGVVAEVNSALWTAPELLYDDPYAAGWLMTVEPADRSWKTLPRGKSAQGWLRTELRRFSEVLDRELSIAAADGGELVAPAALLVEEHRWAALTAAFLDPARASAL